MVGKDAVIIMGSGGSEERVRVNNIRSVKRLKKKIDVGKEIEQ